MIVSSTGLLLWLWIVEINIYLEPVCPSNTAPLPPPFGWVETINVVKRVTANSESNWCLQMFNVLVQCIWNSITNNTNALAMVLLSNRYVLVLVLRIVQGSRIGIRQCFNHTQLNHLGHSCTLVLVLLYTFWKLNLINQPSIKRITSYIYLYEVDKSREKVIRFVGDGDEMVRRSMRMTIGCW